MLSRFGGSIMLLSEFAYSKSLPPNDVTGQPPSSEGATTSTNASLGEISVIIASPPLIW